MAADRELSPLKKAFLALQEMEAKLAAVERAKREPLAIVGIGCRMPGGVRGPEDLRRLLLDGVDAIRDVPADRWDVDAYHDPDPSAVGKIVARGGGFLDEVDRFDPIAFGIAPREAVAMDPQQRLLLEVAWEALEHAGIAPDRLSGSRTGVFVGICTNDYSELRQRSGDPADIDAYYAQGIAHSIASGRISYVLGLQGPSLSIDTACSSSLVAVHEACKSLRTGETDLCLAGGVNLILAPANSITFSKSGMLAPDSRCKTFDARADGFARGEGCGVVALKRLSDALRDGDTIHATILGSAVNQDGPSGGITVPNGPAQVRAIRDALADAGLEPAAIGFVEAHGTGTSLGDPIEVGALAEALGDRDPARPLRIGSIKTNMGHLEAAAGVAGLIKAALAVRDGELPPHLHCATPSPHIPWDEIPIRVQTERAAWTGDGDGDGARRAGVSSFGFSGTNAHVVVGSPPTAPELPADARPRAHHVVPLSAHTPDALRDAAGAWAGALAGSDARVEDVAHTAGAGRAALPERLALVAPDLPSAVEGWRAFAAGETPAGARAGRAPAEPPRVAFLFTGQGSQKVGMARGLYETEPVFRDALDRCAALLEGRLDPPLLDVLYGGTPGADGADDSEAASPLHRTGYTQPALFSVEYALAELWRSQGVRPSVVLGHSVGEYVAAVVAGALSLEDGAMLIAERARRMEALPEGGAMAAVFADEATVREALRRADAAGAVSIAAANGPANTVVSGEAEAVERVCAAFRADGVKSRALQVSHAFHSARMEPMLDGFREVVARATFRRPRIRLVLNRTGRPATLEELSDPRSWCDHVRETVRFADSIAWAAEHGVRLFVECGPAPTLCGMGAKCLSGAAAEESVWIPSLRPGRDDAATFAQAVAAAWTAGADVDFRARDAGRARRRLALPTYPFRRERYWMRSGAARPGAAGRAAGAPDAEPAPAPTPTRSSETHPLLGERLRLPELGWRFERALLAGSVPFVADHVVHGRVVFPATAFLELAAAAAAAGPLRDRGADAAAAPVAVEDLTILEALVLDPERPRAVQIRVEPEEGGGHRFRVHSLGEGDEAFRLHAEGRLALGAAAEAAADEVAAAGTEAEAEAEVAVGAFYDGLAARGLGFGPTFLGVRELARADGAARGAIALPEAEAAAAGAYRVHPALLDAGIQILAAAVPGWRPDDATSPLYMPIGIDRCLFHAGAGAPAQSAVRLRDAAAGAPTLAGDLRLADAAGRPAVTLAGLRLKRVDPRDLQRGRAGLDDWVYRVAWETRAGAGARDAAFLPGPEALAGALAPEAKALAREHGTDLYATLYPDVEALAGEYVVDGLRRLGWSMKPGDRATVDGLLERFAILPRHRRLTRRLLRILEELGLARREEGPDRETWEIVAEPPAVDPEATADRLAERYGEHDAELSVTRRCGAKLAQALTGVADPLQLLFPGGDLAAQSKIYRETPLARAFNSLIRRAVERAVAALPADRPLRVLEIGGGTGGTTAYVLPALPADRTEYTFTDIGKLFVARAHETFGEYPFVRYATLDIDADPLAQGFRAGAYDLILASNVLHATADVRRTLRAARSLLAPSGLLCLFEVTGAQRWVDLTVGLTEGWWAFADADLRPEYTLLDHAGWIDALRASGFASARAVPPASGDPVLDQQTVILARNADAAALAAERDARPAGDWLIVRDAGGAAEALARAVQARGGRTALLAPDDDLGDRMRAALAGELAACRGVAFLPALDVEPALPAEREALDAALERTCRAALVAAQTLAGLSGERPPALLLATRGAVAAGDPGGGAGPVAATLWGLARTVRVEHPELACRAVDLDPATSGDPAARFDSLVDELLDAPDAEPEVALRGGERRVARLARAALPAPAPAAGAAPRRLVYGGSGTLDDVKLVRAERAEPGPDEVEIAIEAAGLNFRDVVHALGMRRDVAALGTECAGVVARAGANVADLEPGDRVLAAAGRFGDFAVVHRGLVARVPANLGLLEAATIPIAFLTADVALREHGGMRAGQTVLVHAAAGGVGMAAVRLARAAGLRVLATAGSPAKRARVRAEGAADVFDSRTPAFAEGVLAATGGRGVDLVLNSLAGEQIEASLRCLAEGGILLELGKTGEWDQARLDRWEGKRPGQRYATIDLSDDLLERPETIGPRLAALVERFGRGELRPLPARGFPLSQAVEAFRFMAAARHTGKIVLVQDGPPPVRADGTYLVTGGLGGLGLSTAVRLAERGAGHLLLVGRGEPDAVARAEIARLRSRGVGVETLAADVGDTGAFERAIAAALADRPPLRGVVHSAGALADGILAQQDWDRFLRVFRAKVHGAWALDRATRGAPLDFFTLYSSMAGTFGSSGQSNHSAANAFLDALAERRAADGRPALSVAWGAWSEIGAAVRHDVAARFGRRGVGTIDPDSGFEVLDRLAGGGEPTATVTPMDWAAFLGEGEAPPFFERLAREAAARRPAARRAAPAAAAPAAGASGASRGLLEALQAAPPAKRRGMLLSRVQECAVRVLDLPPSHPVDRRQPLGEMGLDSLMAVELRNALGAEIDRTLPATLLFDYPTIEGLADHLLRDVLELPTAATPAAGAAAAPDGDRDGDASAGAAEGGLDALSMLDRIEDLSDEEVERLMRQGAETSDGE